ncbi:MAG: hypothetical protein IKI41_05755 [Clostridia bacterium]|nr:hypothetical protein [Clostridia bacterium]
MARICGVRLTPNGKIIMYNPGKNSPEPGDFVVVETAYGLGLGEIVYGSKEVEKEPEGTELRQVVRIATDKDLADASENAELARKAFQICKQKIEEEGLEMKLFKTEFTLDRSRAVFTYMSDQRIDFRNLVKELAPLIRTRIEMVQVGPREHAKIVGGLGVCGRQFCCQSFMTTFEPVTIKMAKDQGLTSNPAKYSGNCGKLLCCIRHEEPAYEYAHGIMPKNGSLIMTPDGPGKIIVVNMLKETCTVKVGLEQNFEIKSYGVDDIRQLTDQERSEYIALRKKERDELDEEIVRRKPERSSAEEGGNQSQGDRGDRERGDSQEKPYRQKNRQDTRKRSYDGGARGADDGTRGERTDRGEQGNGFRTGSGSVSGTDDGSGSGSGYASGAFQGAGEGGENGRGTGRERGNMPKFRQGKQRRNNRKNTLRPAGEEDSSEPAKNRQRNSFHSGPRKGGQGGKRTRQFGPNKNKENRNRDN